MNGLANHAEPRAAASDTSSGIVVLYPCKPCERDSHEHLTHDELAKRLAAIRGYDYGGEFDPEARYDRPLYFVPNDTVVASKAKQSLGVTGEQDLFGGVVPHPFIATKTITHDLLEEHEYAPDGWSGVFSRLVCGKVLPGYSAFSFGDARHAAARLLKHGAVRVKKASSIGGLGQSVVENLNDLDTFLDAMRADDSLSEGVVLEANLNGVATYSIGRVRVGDVLMSYCGTQRLTTSNHGHEVYGGSDLNFVRGDFDELLRLELKGNVLIAIDQARTYHAAALASYPGIVMSRANYDVAQGVDGEGRWRSGVLEQSWRIGGASAAELAALACFQSDPSVKLVRASTTEIYGDNVAVPPGAVLHYQGVDPHVGPLTKFSMLESYANA